MVVLDRLQRHRQPARRRDRRRLRDAAAHRAHPRSSRGSSPSSSVDSSGASCLRRPKRARPKDNKEQKRRFAFLDTRRGADARAARSGPKTMADVLRSDRQRVIWAHRDPGRPGRARHQPRAADRRGRGTRRRARLRRPEPRARLPLRVLHARRGPVRRRRRHRRRRSRRGSRGGVIGTVEGVSLRTTRLRDVEGVVWHVPNGEIKRVGNKSQQWSRALLDIAVDLRHRCRQRDSRDQGDRRRHVARRRLASTRSSTEPEVWGIEELGAQSIEAPAGRSRPFRSSSGVLRGSCGRASRRPSTRPGSRRPTRRSRTAAATRRRPPPMKARPVATEGDR